MHLNRLVSESIAAVHLTKGFFNVMRCIKVLKYFLKIMVDILTAKGSQ